MASVTMLNVESLARVPGQQQQLSRRNRAYRRGNILHAPGGTTRGTAPVVRTTAAASEPSESADEALNKEWKAHVKATEAKGEPFSLGLRRDAEEALELGEPLGRGAMGVVRKATRKSDGVGGGVYSG